MNEIYKCKNCGKRLYQKSKSKTGLCKECFKVQRFSKNVPTK